MRKSRFSNTQQIRILEEAEAGATALEVCRRHGISEQTIYRWRKKRGGSLDRPGETGGATLAGLLTQELRASAVTEGD